MLGAFETAALIRTLTLLRDVRHAPIGFIGTLRPTSIRAVALLCHRRYNDLWYARSAPSHGFAVGWVPRGQLQGIAHCGRPSGGRPVRMLLSCRASDLHNCRATRARAQGAPSLSPAASIALHTTVSVAVGPYCSSGRLKGWRDEDGCAQTRWSWSLDEPGGQLRPGARFCRDVHGGRPPCILRVRPPRHRRRYAPFASRSFGRHPEDEGGPARCEQRRLGADPTLILGHSPHRATSRWSRAGRWSRPGRESSAHAGQPL